MADKIIITEWEDTHVSGAKRASLELSDWLYDWFVGYGKKE